ncbi:MAG: type II secretion system protein G [Acidobacteria bacterium]|nr:type II secretion system protein G [Acidobacteriota bacterium]
MKMPSFNIVLLVVFSLVFAIAPGIPFYLEGKKRQKNQNVVLQQSLWALRRAIDFYSEDLKKPPNSLQDLVDRKYLREVPVDPVTQSNQTWVIERQTIASEPGITDAHSGAAGADPNGKPYNQY